MENNSEISRFLQLRPLDLDKTIVSDVLKAQDQINTYKITNSTIAEIQLYAFQSGILVDTTTTALNPSHYYGVGFSLGSMRYSQWADSLLRQEHSPTYFSSEATIASTQGEYLIYIQTIPAGLYSGNVIVYLDQDQLISQFQSIQYEEGGMIGVLDGSGRQLFSHNPGGLKFDQLDRAKMSKQEGAFVQRIEGKTYLVFYFTSDLGEWTYYAVLPQQAVLEPSREIQQFLMAMILVSLFVSGVLAFYFAGKTSRPVATITGLLSRNNQFPSPGELPSRIARLLETNQSLRETLRLHMSNQRVSLLYRLLSGAFHDEEEIKSEFLQVGLTLEAPYYCLVLVAMPGLTHSGGDLEGSFAYKQLVKEVLAQSFHRAVGACDVDLHRCLLLLPGEGEPAQMSSRLERQAQEILTQLSPAVEGGLTFSACYAEGLVQIPASFSKLQSFEGFWEEEQPINWLTQEMGADTQTFFYPLSLELRLIAAVQDGRAAMVEDLFQLIQQQNRGCLAQGGSGAQLLLQALYGTLLRLVNECGANQEELLTQCRQVGELGADCPALDRLGRTEACFLAAAASYDSLRQNHHTDNLVEKIQKYLQSHFTDPQLSLTSAAAEFHITEPYLSRIFKQGTGENFSKYVERLRMEKAKELISAGELKLSEIAQQVGYNLPQVFRRVYKRNFGVSPSEDMKS